MLTGNTDRQWFGVWAAGMGLVGGIGYAVDQTGSAWLRFGGSFVAWLVLRRFARFAPHRRALPAGLIAWGLIVLLPWGYYLALGGWEYLGRPIDRALVATLPVHLVALAGIWFAGAIPLRRPEPEDARRRIEWRAVWPQLCLTSFVLSALALLAATTFSADGGAVQLDGQYGQEAQANSGLLATQFLPFSAGLAALVGSALSRGYRRRPAQLELLAVAFAVIAELASGVRIRAFVIAFGWLLIHWSARRRVVRRPGFQALINLSKVFGVVIGFISLIVLSNVLVAFRSGVAPGEYGSGYLDFSAMSLDVVGSADVWMTAADGQIGHDGDGFDLLRTPLRLVPTALGGLAGADAVVEASQEVLTNGASAPFWFALLYDWGEIGVFAGMAGLISLFELGFGAFRRRLRDEAAAQRLGALITLILFMLLSRLPPTLFVTTTIFSLTGLAVARVLTRRVATPDVSPSGDDRAGPTVPAFSS